ncbi:damage-control phosphatase ARMT1-like [Chrysoperla carnea]|uniref:damage-control phosphatase ARMT1-like n=1 Tax=Chrysoperla carnea TaxID=189513 RepID=UPI001D068EA2|nr:damage-control phosphatase ARMT1-like [Chrysoperla carnea]
MKMDMETPKNVKLSAFYKRSFAHYTIKERLPVILTKIIDYLVREKEEISKEYQTDISEDLKTVIGEISKLKYEIQTNKELKPLTDVNGPDAKIWNDYLVEQSKDEIPTYFNTTWLYAECYVYRRLKDIFDCTLLKNFDPFRNQKQDAYFTSHDAMTLVSEFLVYQLHKCLRKDEELEIFFKKLMKLCLWGNKCDLSLSLGAESSQKQDPLDELDSLDKFIIVDHIDDIWKVLNTFCAGTITIVTDNAGYELFTDLCLADFLITSNYASQVHFRVKAMPWFISDVMPKDFNWLIDTACKSADENVAMLGKRWLDYQINGKFLMQSDVFWTLPHAYAEMKNVDSELYTDLSKSNLIIFKGDLNYRKLLGDINWETTTCFHDSLRGFNPTDLCALRTLKADLVSGLKPGDEERLQKESSEWLISGEYGVIQYDPNCECI